MGAMRGHELTERLRADFGVKGTAGSRIAVQDIDTGDLFAIVGTDVTDVDGTTLHLINVRQS